jgi:uncharacterized protein YecE (DUF72 family)
LKGGQAVSSILEDEPGDRMAHKPRILIGTSGWHYKHWIGPLYPKSLPPADWLAYYATRFATVELNNTFYHLPTESAVANWEKTAPKGFLFAVKASRYITHIKKLREPDESLKLFLERMAPLSDKLGPILYQLPPSLGKNLELLEGLAEATGKKQVSVVEFRNKAWFSDDVYELMDRKGLAFCVHDWDQVHSPRLRTGKTVYIRPHGTTGRYGGRYADEQLEDWAGWIEEENAKGASVFAYFNNDSEGHAVVNAVWLAERLAKAAQPTR